MKPIHLKIIWKINLWKEGSVTLRTSYMIVQHPNFLNIFGRIFVPAFTAASISALWLFGCWWCVPCGPGWWWSPCWYCWPGAWPPCGGLCDGGVGAGPPERSTYIRPSFCSVANCRPSSRHTCSTRGFKRCTWSDEWFPLPTILPMGLISVRRSTSCHSPHTHTCRWVWPCDCAYLMRCSRMSSASSTNCPCRSMVSLSTLPTALFSRKI